MTFIAALIQVKRVNSTVKRIKRVDWTDNQYYFFNEQRIQASFDIGGIFIDDILHTDWEVF